MIELFHISDLHFGKDRSRNNKAKKLLERIDNNHRITSGDHKFLLITGDITEHGFESQFNLAQESLKPFKDRIFLAPGNHDYGYKGFIYYSYIAQGFDRDLAAPIGIKHKFISKKPYKKLIKDSSNNRLLVICLNSCLMSESIWDIAMGEIGEEQLNELDNILNSGPTRNTLKLIALHHIPNRPAQGLGMVLKDWKKLMKVVKNRADILAFGHEGPMDDIKGKTLRAAIGKERKMAVRSGQSEGVDYVLDANRSIDESSCYHIVVDQGKLTIEKEKLMKGN